MIRHVRRHFICFTMCILTGAVLLPMIALNVIPAFMSYNQNKTVLQQAVQNEIRLRSPKPSKQPDKQPSENDPFIPQTTTVVSGTTVSQYHYDYRNHCWNHHGCTSRTDSSTARTSCAGVAHETSSNDNTAGHDKAGCPCCYDAECADPTQWPESGLPTG